VRARWGAVAGGLGADCAPIARGCAMPFSWGAPWGRLRAGSPCCAAAPRLTTI